jgi:endonuclease YncB( thermonuclease family)/thiol-disulfide isomerase/thioredoxin
MRHLRRTALLLPVILSLLLSTAPAGASLLRALVAEVTDGATLVVVSGNRRLNVVLRGVELPRDAREAERARQHLASLALGREVTVEYTGLRGQSIHGRVLCGGRDLGLQVVRDGAAFYDEGYDNALGAAERQLYAESEGAARAERRGVWQAEGVVLPAVAPAQLALSAEVSVAPKPVAPKSVRRARPALSTEDAIINRIASAPSPGKARQSPGGAATPKQTRWPLNAPGENFDFSQYLGQGRTTIVYFYADWCPACRAVSPAMKSINQGDPGVEVFALDIDHWGSPVASAHGVNFVPYFQIYDESGALVAEGKQAARWLMDEAARRAR